MTVDPTGLAVTIDGAGTAHLSWDAATDPGLLDYSVFRRTPSTGAVFTPGVDTPVASGLVVPSYADVGLASARYDWQVFARLFDTSDSFNRANSAVTMGSTDGGVILPWTPQAGTWGITSNQAYETTGGGGQFTTVVDTGLSDCTVEVSFTAFDDCGLAWRATNSNNHWLTNNTNAFKKVGGGFTGVGANFAVALGRGVQAGDRMRVVVSGNNHSIYVQLGSTGAYILASSFTDAFNATATKHGLRSNGAAGGNDKFDNFSVVP